MKDKTMATKVKTPKKTSKSLQDPEVTIRDEDVPEQFKKYWKNPKYNQRLVIGFIMLHNAKSNKPYSEILKEGVFR
jgi:hypothetical protein